MDAGIIGAAYFFSWYLRFKSGFFVQDAGVLPAKTYFSALFLIIPGYLLLYSIFQLYMPRRVKSYRKELMDIIRANGIGFMIFILVLYFIKQEHFSRQMLCIFFFTINEQISNFAQTYPTNLKASSNEALLFMRRYRFANCSCFSCCFKDAYPSSNVQ